MATLTKTKIWVAILLAGDYIFTLFGQFRDNFTRIVVSEANPAGIWFFSNFHPAWMLIFYIPEILITFWIIDKTPKWFSVPLCLFLIISEFGCDLGWYQYYTRGDLYFWWTVLFYIVFSLGIYFTFKKEIELVLSSKK